MYKESDTLETFLAGTKSYEKIQFHELEDIKILYLEMKKAYVKKSFIKDII